MFTAYDWEISELFDGLRACLCKTAAFLAASYTDQKWRYQPSRLQAQRPVRNDGNGGIVRRQKNHYSNTILGLLDNQIFERIKMPIKGFNTHWILTHATPCNPRSSGRSESSTILAKSAISTDDFFKSFWFFSNFHRSIFFKSNSSTSNWNRI